MRLDIIQVNEINFDLIKKYIESGEKLPTLEKISKAVNTTKSELEYNRLEPWIQWPSFYTGKPFEGHNIFRLGDFDKYNGENILKYWVKMGKEVVCISPMNLSNSLEKNGIFLPDPWINTHCSGSWSLKWVYAAIKSFVNNNSSGRVSKLNYLRLLMGLLPYMKINDYVALIKYFRTIKGRKYRKAVFLDIILARLYKNLTNKKVDFRGMLFLNSGAHIQHHYLHNAKIERISETKNPSWYVDPTSDPFLEVIREYDKILGMLLDDNRKTLILTGLSQEPYEQTKLYWRLTSHRDFLKDINVSFKDVRPRMTRDFEVYFESDASKQKCEEILGKIVDENGQKVFGDFQSGEKSLFASLLYPKDVKGRQFFLEDKSIDFSKYVSFVALKNGKHSAEGFWYYSGLENALAPKKIDYIWDFFNQLILLENEQKQ